MDWRTITGQPVSPGNRLDDNPGWAGNTMPIAQHPEAAPQRATPAPVRPGQPRPAHLPAYESPQDNVSNGAGRHFFAGATASGDLRRGLIAFAIAGHVPAGSIVASATLKLRMTMTAASSQLCGSIGCWPIGGKGSRMPQTRKAQGRLPPPMMPPGCIHSFLTASGPHPSG